MVLLLAFLFFQTTGSGGITLEPVEKIPVHFDWAENKQDMAYSNGKAYFFSLTERTVFIFDLNRRELVQKLGRSGNGPGEFPSNINNVTAFPNRIAVQTASWIHFFDFTGRFLSRTHTRVPSVVHISPFTPNKYLVGILHLYGADQLSNLSFIGVLDGADGTVSRMPSFGKPNVFNNIFLSRYVFASDERYIVVGQVGSSEVGFWGRDGSIERTIVLERNPAEITFSDEPVLSSQSSRNRNNGNQSVDQRRPSFFVVRDISVGSRYTVVSGTFQHEGRRRSLAFIDHSTWEVSYPSLPSACSSPHIEEDKLICLNRTTGMPEIHVYKISK